MWMLKYMFKTQGTYPITLISLSQNFIIMVIKIKYLSIFTYSDKVQIPTSSQNLKLFQFFQFHMHIN